MLHLETWLGLGTVLLVSLTLTYLIAKLMHALDRLSER